MDEKSYRLRVLDHLPDGLIDAFDEYERALMANDLAALDDLFEPNPATVRTDHRSVLVGHDAIRSFRRDRGGAPPRTVVDVLVRQLAPDVALVVAIVEPASGGRGQQVQVWRSGSGRWRVLYAHVNAPVADATVFRVAGAPLVAPLARGPLDSHTVAVKDLFAVKGFAVGAGVPAFLRTRAVESEHAPAVAALVASGASIVGIAHTDEFAFSITGKNPHFATPPNAAVDGALPGGSSSGSASAVALGLASIGLGTDTGGSIRVPASYQGLWGLRSTHGRVPRRGVVPLAPIFDTIGWLARDATTLRLALEASVPPRPSERLSFVVDPALLDCAESDVRAVVADALGWIPHRPVSVGNVDHLVEIFRVVQGAEAWAQHGQWINRHPGSLGDDVASRFRWASSLDAFTIAAARTQLDAERHHLRKLLSGRVLLLPSAASVAPPAASTSADLEAVRVATLRLTCIAGIAGLPALSVPGLLANGKPVGLCLVGPPDSERALIDMGSRLFASRA